MRYLLDTNICIYIIKRKPITVLRRFECFSIGDIGISSISVAELQYGIQKSRHFSTNKRALEQFLVPLTIVDFDHQAAVVYGEIRAKLEAEGQPIGSLDMLIAAHALRLNATLVTNNTKEFVRVPDLKLTNWAGH